MEKRWVLNAPGNPERVEELSKALNLSPTLSALLVQRGIHTFEEAKYFFRPQLSHLHDPFLMKGMEQAVQRLNRALATKEKILVYGDYDVDGTTSVALVYSFLRKYSSTTDFYLPDRYKEGYGISTAGIDWAKTNGFTLIIALDCGIKAVDKISYANSLGIEFIICDHHRPGEVLPDACSVLNPKQQDCLYPYKELSGCGIGFKLMQGFATVNNIPFNELEELLDLVAVSIAADIVPITGENRTLAYFGLQRLNKSPRPGFRAICELNNIKRELTISDVVFVIGPRINAAGRVKDARYAVALLIASDMPDAKEKAGIINENNTERRALDVSITEHALSIIENDASFRSRKSTVVYHADWHKGVIGIVASRLTEKYYRPTIVLTHANGYATGSARSVKDYDVYAAIEACSDLLEQFGGHMYAAGLTLKEENIPAFAERFEQFVSSSIKDRMLVPEIEIDAMLSFDEITPAFFNILKQFAPFGPGNMTPVFFSKNVADTGNGRIVGNNHLKLSLTQEGCRNRFDAIGFRLGDHEKDALGGTLLDVCYTVEENEWNNQKSLQLNLRDIRPAGG